MKDEDAVQADADYVHTYVEKQGQAIIKAEAIGEDEVQIGLVIHRATTHLKDFCIASTGPEPAASHNNVMFTSLPSQYEPRL